MIPLSRRRPASITAFAVLFFASALVVYIERMLFDLPDGQRMLRKVPSFISSHDAAIVWFSAWFSTALIPIAMVWLSAVRFARWMVTIFTGLKLLVVVQLATKDPRYLPILGLAWYIALLFQLAAVALLFTPPSHRWFALKGEEDPAVFE